jgi:DNA-binding transcriptional MerR regulator
MEHYYSLPRVSDLLSPDRVAELLGVTTKTLANWRARGTGPAYVRVAGRVYYTHEAYAAYWRDQIAGAA